MLKNGPIERETELADMRKGFFLIIKNIRKRIVFGSVEEKQDFEDLSRAIIVILKLTRQYISQLAEKSDKANKAKEMQIIISGTLADIEKKVSIEERLKSDLEAIRGVVKTLLQEKATTDILEIIDESKLDDVLTERGWGLLVADSRSGSKRKLLTKIMDKITYD